MTEFDVAQIVVPDRSRSVFTITVPASSTSETFERIQGTWRHTWEPTGVVPRLLILTPNVKIEALSDAELRAVGLMRIPEGEDR